MTDRIAEIELLHEKLEKLERFQSVYDKIGALLGVIVILAARDWIVTGLVFLYALLSDAILVRLRRPYGKRLEELLK